MTTCPMCAEDVGASDAVCPHCGHLLRASAAPPSAPAHAPVVSSAAPAPSGAGPRTPSTSRAAQWAVPGVLAVALVLALVVKFAWWDRRFDLATLGVPGDTAFRCTRNDVAGTSHCTAEGAGHCGNFAAAMAMARVARNLEPGQTQCIAQDVAFCFSYREAGQDRDFPVCTINMTECRTTADRYRSGPDASRVSRCAAVSVRDGRFVLRDVASDAAAVTPRTSSPNTPLRDAGVTPITSEPTPARAMAPTSPPVPPIPPAPPAPALHSLSPTATSASSFISNGRNQFAPERAFDGDPATTWTEAARGPGDGEWLQATFAGPQLVQRVRVTTGWNHTSPRGEDLFTANSHLRRVRLVLGPNTTFERDVGADQREVIFDGLDAETATVRVEAVSVWPGARWADLCIGEVVIEGEPLANGPVAAPSAEESPRADGDGSRPCTYATQDNFHLRANPTASRAGAVEVTGNPVVELLHAEEVRRRHQRLFRVRLPDGREGWMFVPDADVPAGCER